MSEKEIKLFVVFLQKLDGKIWTDRLDRLLWRTIWTFNKQYDREEERDHMMDDITKYLNWEAKYIDSGYEEDKKFEDERREQQKKINDVISKMWSVISFFTK